MPSRQSELCDGLTGFSVMGAKTLLPRFLRQQPGGQGSLFSAKIEFFISMDILQKVILHTPARGPRQALALALAFPAVCFHWVASALRARLYILAAPFVKDTSFPRGTWEKRVFCVGRGNECLFFFSRMQKTNKSSENCTHHLAFGFSPYPKGTDILVALAPS